MFAAFKKKSKFLLLCTEKSKYPFLSQRKFLLWNPLEIVLHHVIFSVSSHTVYMYYQ